MVKQLTAEIIKIATFNCQGISGKAKRYDILSYLKDIKYDIICLQDTHLRLIDLTSVKNIWPGNVFINGTRSNSRGVMILIKNSFEYEVCWSDSDDQGNMLILDIKINNTHVLLLNIYGPNSDSPGFYETIKQVLYNRQFDHLIWCGDFNISLNPAIDTFDYVGVNNPKARQKLLDIIDECTLTDTYRYFFPDRKRFTWRKKKPLKQARLDLFLTSASTTDIIQSIDIKPGYRSDHSLVVMSVILNSFERGPGTWKLNTNLLKDEDYLTMVKAMVQSEKLKYAVPVYNMDKLEYILDDNLHLTIGDDTFLEMLLLRIRGETIKFASCKRKKQDVEEKRLIDEIEKIENNITVDLNLLENKKRQLQNIREERMEGTKIRSRVEWLGQGEKPTKYFASLERKLYIDKTVKKITLDDNTICTDQKKILQHLKSYYGKLFQSKDHDIDDIDLYTHLKKCKINKLNDQQASTLEGELTIEELGNSLYRMKNNKCPGIDGFPAEFFKMFWGYLKIWIQRALICSFQKGILSTSLKQCIIICLPKKGKNREFIKNWRPLSMLSVIYKIASASIANRLKPHLDFLIDRTQSGFVDGRYIGESTRLVYDLMQFTEEKDIPGLLVSIDFQKAFDSISWTFIYQTLKFLGFKPNFIKWIKLFNNDISASVLQCGFLSDPIHIDRGCRQGDPISPYLFIIAAQILSVLISQNPRIGGISINGMEFKITQYADDTTLFLDGTISSLENALNVLEIFGSMSGLKVNKDKTKVIWIGKKINCAQKLLKGLQWESSQFDLLGLTFSTDLNNMLDLNFQSKLKEIKNTIQSWESRYLTPMGKITVVKTFLLPKLNHLFQSLPTPPSKHYKRL